MKTWIPPTNAIRNQDPIDLSNQIDWEWEISLAIQKANALYMDQSPDKPILYLFDRDYSNYIPFDFNGRLKPKDLIMVLVPHFKIQIEAQIHGGSRYITYVVTAHVKINAMSYEPQYERMNLSYNLQYFMGNQYDTPVFTNGLLGGTLSYKLRVQHIQIVGQTCQTIELASLIPYSLPNHNLSSGVTDQSSKSTLTGDPISQSKNDTLINKLRRLFRRKRDINENLR